MLYFIFGGRGLVVYSGLSYDRPIIFKINVNYLIYEREVIMVLLNILCFLFCCKLLSEKFPFRFGLSVKSESLLLAACFSIKYVKEREHYLPTGRFYV